MTMKLKPINFSLSKYLAVVFIWLLFGWQLGLALLLWVADIKIVLRR